MCGHTRGPVIYSKFHRNPFNCFGTPGGQNLAFPITLARRFYNSLYYRTSRDFILMFVVLDLWLIDEKLEPLFYIIFVGLLKFQCSSRQRRTE